MMAGDEDTRSNAPDASSSQANDNTPEHGRQVSNIIDGEQEGSNAAVDPNSRPAMSTATTQPPTLASPFAPTDNNLAGHSRVTSPAPPTTNSRGAEFAGGDMGAQQRATNLGEVVEQSANREIAVVNADQSDSDEVNQTNDRLDDVPDSDQFESRETSESEDQSTEPSAPAARRFISPSDEEEDEPLDFGEDFGAEGDEEKEEVDEEQEQWNVSTYPFTLPDTTHIIFATTPLLDTY
jgi:hypothetical protein